MHRGILHLYVVLLYLVVFGDGRHYLEPFGRAVLRLPLREHQVLENLLLRCRLRELLGRQLLLVGRSHAGHFLYALLHAFKGLEPVHLLLEHVLRPVGALSVERHHPRVAHRPPARPQIGVYHIVDVSHSVSTALPYKVSRQIVSKFFHISQCCILCRLSLFRNTPRDTCASRSFRMPCTSPP